jgi:cathepsin L
VNIFFFFLGKSYHSIEEETYRRTVFKKNALVVEEHNKEYNLGKKSYSLGINQFADLVRKMTMHLKLRHNQR